MSIRLSIVFILCIGFFAAGYTTAKYPEKAMEAYYYVLHYINRPKCDPGLNDGYTCVKIDLQASPTPQ